MKTYPLSFLLLLQQVSLGGLFALAVTPFHEIERGFYKSTTGVLVIAAILALWGKATLFLKGDLQAGGTGATWEVVIYAFFVVLLLTYLLTLWGDRMWLRARSFSFSLLLGLVALGLSSFSFHHAPFWSVETFLYPVGVVLSALLLGTAMVGMLIGHWYLIDTGQSLEPFLRVFKFFVIVLVTQTTFLLIAPALLYLLGTPPTASGLGRLWQDHLLLLAARFLVSQVGPLVLSYMIWQTLKIPNTMAATGLFYIVLLGVVVGEILARQLLALTALPL